MPRHLDREEKQLWDAYKATPSDENRNRIAEHYRPKILKRLATHCSKQKLSHRYHDLLSTVDVRLLTTTIPRFNPFLGKAFMCFADRSIRGAIKDELRRMDKLRRKARAFENKKQRAAEELRQDLLRDPTDTELAYYLGVSEEDLEENSGIDVQSVFGSDPGAGLMASLATSVEAPELSVLSESQVERLTEGLSILERCLILMRFCSGMSNAEIGVHFFHDEKSPSRVSQLIMRGLRKIDPLKAREIAAEYVGHDSLQRHSQAH